MNERPIVPSPLKIVLVVGFVALALSTLCLFLSKHAWQSQSLLLAGVCMLFARCCGLIAMGGGVVAIYNHLWWQGVVLLGGAVGLPILSLTFYGFI